MSIVTAILVYFLTFWTVLFMVLPWGNHKPEELETGMAGSAPAKPRIKQKFLITLVISTVISAIIYLIIHLNLIDFYEISREMIREDEAQ